MISIFNTIFQIIEKMMSGLGDDEIDPAMMAALMATTALVAQGASNEEVSCSTLHAVFFIRDIGKSQLVFF